MLSPLSEREGHGTGRAAHYSRPAAATGSKAFTARISLWETPPIQHTTERSQDEFGAGDGMQLGGRRAPGSFLGAGPAAGWDEPATEPAASGQV
jgi:hypothetical protein